jgi:hypothetical protein
MHAYKHSIDEFATTLGGVVTPARNGVRTPHPFDESRCVLVYPNRDSASRTAFFVQLDDDERINLKRHFGEILNTAGIDARDTGLRSCAVGAGCRWGRNESAPCRALKIAEFSVIEAHLSREFGSDGNKNESEPGISFPLGTGHALAAFKAVHRNIAEDSSAATLT